MRTGTFLARVMQQAMPAEGSGRYCVMGRDYSRHANFPCLGKMGGDLSPQHLQLLEDLRANFTHRCSAFNAHQDYGFFRALRVDHARTLTLASLRHPVERAVSYYFYLLQRGTLPQAFQPRGESDHSGLLAFAQHLAQPNHQTRLLGGDMVCRWPGSGERPGGDAELLDAAKRNLETFCVVAITEFMGESLQQLAEAAGWPEAVLFSNTTRENATPHPRVPLEVRRHIAAINHLDMQLYEYAVQLLLRRSSGAATRLLKSGSSGPQEAVLGSSSATASELEAGLQRRQCPPRTGGLPLSVAFLHVPKTAGLFLARVMQQAMPAEGRGRYCIRGRDHSWHAIHPCIRENGPLPPQVQLLEDLRANFTHRCSAFNAHQDYGFFRALRVDHTRTLTLASLRHPVERAVSHYYFQMKQTWEKHEMGNPWGFEFWPRNHTDFSGLLAFAAERHHQANLHTRLLGGATGCQWPGGPPVPRRDAEMLEAAKRNLETFCVVAISEFMGESLQQLAEAAGWPEAVLFSNTTRENATPHPHVPLEVWRQIAAINHLDMQLYEYAVPVPPAVQQARPESLTVQCAHCVRYLRVELPLQLYDGALHCPQPLLLQQGQQPHALSLSPPAPAQSPSQPAPLPLAPVSQQAQHDQQQPLLARRPGQQVDMEGAARQDDAPQQPAQASQSRAGARASSSGSSALRRKKAQEQGGAAATAAGGGSYSLAQQLELRRQLQDQQHMQEQGLQAAQHAQQQVLNTHAQVELAQQQQLAILQHCGQGAATGLAAGGGACNLVQQEQQLLLLHLRQLQQRQAAAGGMPALMQQQQQQQPPLQPQLQLQTAPATPAQQLPIAPLTTTPNPALPSMAHTALQPQPQQLFHSAQVAAQPPPIAAAKQQLPSPRLPIPSGVPAQQAEAPVAVAAAPAPLEAPQQQGQGRQAAAAAGNVGSSPDIFDQLLAEMDFSALDASTPAATRHHSLPPQPSQPFPPAAPAFGSCHSLPAQPAGQAGGGGSGGGSGGHAVAGAPSGGGSPATLSFVAAEPAPADPAAGAAAGCTQQGRRLRKRAAHQASSGAGRAAQPHPQQASAAPAKRQPGAEEPASAPVQPAAASPPAPTTLAAAFLAFERRRQQG
ncbi:hypothetical protein CHLNCDRAFT_138788 [Chlorella variabilis]|uniref:Sulfotransferase domain-containing protein n=1 Tax=Chlorella variabilis TaxID=554065 RepID=E1ZNR6_CHLVA|nr:hypothetical protein CHLNCDRAFT_138788 [Chlorella variabilis]EFN52463.1 hypothetical protein CHLNCDRAFT_138788 [Chlorella variabilis]|eukprot:XP_005844565.1 hypothetical protein CHLNCDRAFT_138788 [Chlorella variabilis]